VDYLTTGLLLDIIVTRMRIADGESAENSNIARTSAGVCVLDPVKRTLIVLRGTSVSDS
jgi:hypothetical protein